MAYLEELMHEFRNGAKIRCGYWKKGMYIQNIDDDDIDIEDLPRDDWEFYQEPIDWKYIIEKKCLCWFWDDENIGNFIAELGDFRDGSLIPFKCKNGASWRNCRPVRKDEVTFYEDKKDVL
mgnify:FL=1